VLVLLQKGLINKNRLS